MLTAALWHTVCGRWTGLDWTGLDWPGLAKRGLVNRGLVKRGVYYIPVDVYIVCGSV